MSNQEAKIFFDLGVKYFKEKDYISAEKNFEKALNLAPKRLSILDNLASIYFINSKFEKSLTIINELFDLNVKEKKIIHLKYKVLRILGRIEELKKFYKDLNYKVLKVFDVKNSVNSKNSFGGTSEKNIKNMIKKYKKELK